MRDLFLVQIFTIFSCVRYSGFQFKLNEFGVIEMVTGEDDMDSKLSVDTDEGDGIHQESQGIVSLSSSLAL